MIGSPRTRLTAAFSPTPATVRRRRQPVASSPRRARTRLRRSRRAVRTGSRTGCPSRKRAPARPERRPRGSAPAAIGAAFQSATSPATQIGTSGGPSISSRNGHIWMRTDPALWSARARPKAELRPVVARLVDHVGQADDESEERTGDDRARPQDPSRADEREAGRDRDEQHDDRAACCSAQPDGEAGPEPPSRFAAQLRPDDEEQDGRPDQAGRSSRSAAHVP